MFVFLCPRSFIIDRHVALEIVYVIIIITNGRVCNAVTNFVRLTISFFRPFFPWQTERHFIMQVVCEATQCKDVHIRVAALQCLVKIMSLYYQFMESYMGPALFAVSS